VRTPGARDLIREHLPRIQQYLDAHERVEKITSLRAVWLGWQAIARLTGDALALARARDRIIDRLVRDGYGAERNLPGFLRTAGHLDRARIAAIQAHFGRVREEALKWCAESLANEREMIDVAQTSGHFADLMFAFGFARLGAAMQARDLSDNAAAAVVRKKGADKTWLVHDFLVSAYRYRVDEAIHGRPHTGPLPEELREELDANIPNLAANNDRYVVNRLREQSQILEPQERFNPYRDYTKEHVDDLEKRLVALADERDPKLLRQAIASLLRTGAGAAPTPEQTLIILAEALVLSPRVEESFTLELLDLLEPTLERLTSAQEESPALLELKARALGRAMFMAANYDHHDIVRRVWPHFVRLLHRSQHAKAPPPEVNRLFGQCLRSMRKLDLSDDIDAMIAQAEALVKGSRSVADLHAAAGKEWPITLTTLLHLAGGWLMFQRTDKALEVFDAAAALLFSRESREHADGLFPQQYTNLAVAYVMALGRAPAEFALQRIMEMYRRMRRLKDTFTTARYYSRLHLNIIEATVLALVSDDCGLDPGARRWLDEDEFLVRRRIHRDHRQMLSAG
jgi:hypothetical protein